MSCDKTAYPGRKAAQKAARTLRSRSGEPFRAYVCDGTDGSPACGKWHLTTTGGSDGPTPPPRPARVRGRIRRASVHTLEELESLAAEMRRSR